MGSGDVEGTDIPLAAVWRTVSHLYLMNRAAKLVKAVSLATRWRNMSCVHLIHRAVKVIYTVSAPHTVTLHIVPPFHPLYTTAETSEVFVLLFGRAARGDAIHILNGAAEVAKAVDVSLSRG